MPRSDVTSPEIIIRDTQFLVLWVRITSRPSTINSQPINVFFKYRSGRFRVRVGVEALTIKSPFDRMPLTRDQ
jgi:hypothetical protein